MAMIVTSDPLALPRYLTEENSDLPRAQDVLLVVEVSDTTLQPRPEWKERLGT